MLTKQTLLMVGPTGMPDSVIHAMDRQVISHRGQEFSETTKKLNEKLKKIFQTDQEVMTLTASGTGAMEASVQNCFSPGDEVVVAVLGVFSERMALIAETYGLNVKRVAVPLGEAAGVQQVMQQVTKKTKGVFIVQNESSTGVMNDIQAFGEALKDTDALLVVDAVSAMGAIDLQFDAWHVDVAFTSSQKALMSPPGLSLIALSEKAWKASEHSTFPRFYFDLQKARKMNAIGQHPWTPGIYQILALDAATDMILAEGLQNVFARHKFLSRLTVEGMRKAGIPLYPKEEKSASITVNTFRFDQSVEFVRRLNEEYGIVISGGQDYLKPTTFRVGTMGYVTETDVHTFLFAADEILKKLR